MDNQINPLLAPMSFEPTGGEVVTDVMSDEGHAPEPLEVVTDVTPEGCVACNNTGLKDGDTNQLQKEVCSECNGSPYGDPDQEKG